MPRLAPCPATVPLSVSELFNLWSDRGRKVNEGQQGHLAPKVYLETWGVMASRV